MNKLKVHIRRFGKFKNNTTATENVKKKFIVYDEGFITDCQFGK